MIALQQLGTFEVTSPKLVVIDPGYTLDTADLRYGGCFVSPVRLGTWRVELTMDAPPTKQWWVAPRMVVARHTLCDQTYADSDWHRVTDEIGQDGGVIGIYDVSHFQDGSLVPQNYKPEIEAWASIPARLWYSYVCDLLGRETATVVPFGVVVHWDGGMDVDAVTRGPEIVAVRLAISGWPDEI